MNPSKTSLTAIDLFCGRGGWTNGLLEAGFTVYGFDINQQPEYKGIFIQADVLDLTVDDLRKYKPNFATCSSPCEQFSVHCMKHFHKNPPYPELGIKLFNHSRALLEELGIPYVMENVRCAEKFVGKAVNHCGPFYLWGNAVPAVMSYDAYKLGKNFRGSGSVINKAVLALPIEQRRAIRNAHQKPYGNHANSAAIAAQIPHVLGKLVANAALNLCGGHVR